MAVAVRGVDTAVAEGTSLVLSLSDASAQANDFAIILFTGNVNTATFTIDRSGWTSYGEQTISNTQTCNVYWKVLTSTDITNNTITLSHDEAASRIAAGITVFSGVDTTNPLDPVSPNPTFTQDTVADANPEFPAIDPTNSAYVASFIATNCNSAVTSMSPTSGWTERFDAITTTASREAGVHCQTLNSSPTSASIASGTITTNTSTAFNSGWTFALAEGSTAQTLSPTAIASGEVFGTTVLDVPTDMAPTAIASAEVFGTAVIDTTVTLNPSAIASAESVSSPVLDVPFTLSPTAVGSAEAFGTPVLDVPTAMVPDAIASAETFGTPEGLFVTNLNPTAIASGELFGTPLLDVPVNMEPLGIATSEVFGTLSISTSVTLSPNAIASAETFGTPEIPDEVILIPAGIATSETFGDLELSLTVTLGPNGIASVAMVGNAILTGDGFEVVYMGSKRDILRQSLEALGFTEGSVSDRLLAYEQSVYNEAEPTEPLSLNDYLTYGTVSAFEKNDIQ